MPTTHLLLKAPDGFNNVEELRRWIIGGHAGYFIRERAHRGGNGFVLDDAHIYTSGTYVMHTVLPITPSTLSK